MRTGLANMAFGVFIVAIGALVTGLTYSMVDQGGGTYVVAYGAFVVGAWRFLLGLFQVVRGAFGAPDIERTVPPPASFASRASTGAPDASIALRIVGAVLLAEAALRLVFLGILLWRVPVAVILDNLPFLLTGVVLPAGLVMGAFTAGTLFLRNRPGAIAFGIGFCAVGLLFQAYVLARLLSVSVSSVPWFTWALFTVHVAVYVAGLVVLVGKRRVSVASPNDRSDAHSSPGALS